MIDLYLPFCNKYDYNKSLRHFRLITSIVERMNDGENLADIVKELDDDDVESMDDDRVISILNVLLISKYEYKSSSINLPMVLSSVNEIYRKIAACNTVDIILSYNHPVIGACLLNNVNSSLWSQFSEFGKGDYVIFFVKAFEERFVPFEKDVIGGLRKLFEGDLSQDFNQFHDAVFEDRGKKIAQDGDSKASPLISDNNEKNGDLYTEKISEKKEFKKGSAAGNVVDNESQKNSGSLKITPKYSCQVTNELFHNGNVEAWKNIIESYQISHEGIKVLIYHNGEKINNINTLFKWGKVKNGDVILFSLAGSNFKNISKLQKYLYEGASNRFQKYLKKDIHSSLELF